MKAFYKIHGKPRGRWRPLLEWGISFSPQEEQEAKELNIKREINFCLCSDLGDNFNKYAGKLCVESRFILPFPGELYWEGSNQVGGGSSLGNTGAYSNKGCPFYEKGRCYRDGDSLPFTEKKRLEWRPGRRPDYSDYIEPLRIFLRCLLKEAERRFTEARESAPSDEWLMEEEFDSFSWRTTEDGTEVAERKLRVIRK